MWGSKAWLNIPQKLRVKDFEPRAEVGYLVGYSEHQRGAYRVWIPKWNEIIVSTDVRFDENVPTGDVDHSTDEYWLEARKARTTYGKGIVRFEADFQYLVGQIFYDPDYQLWYRVLSVKENKRGDIVGEVADYLGASEAPPGSASLNTRGELDDRDVISYHVAEIEKMILGPSLSALAGGETVMETTKTAVGIEPRGAAVGHSEGWEKPAANNRALERSPYDRPTRVSDTENPEINEERKHCSLLSELEGVLPTHPNPVCLKAAVEFVGDIAEPHTYKEAVGGIEASAWLESIANERNNLESRGVVEVVPTVPGKKKVSVKYVFKKKTKHGVVSKYKTRIVARGFTQVEGIDYKETASPVARMNTMRLFIKVSLDSGHHIMMLDVEAAFLNGVLEEEIYIDTPEGWDIPQGHSLRLRKAIYGLKQSSRVWYIMFREFLIARGLKPCYSDPCLFVNEDKSLMVLIYVDDVIIACKRMIDYEELVEAVRVEYGVGDHGVFDWYLGLAIEHTNGTIFIHQKDYVDKMLVKYELADEKPEATPMIEKYVIVKDINDELFEEYDIRGKIGSLMYLAVCSRPDIAFAVCYLARFITHPSAKVCTAVDRIFRYLAGTRELGINFEREMLSILKLLCDADFGGDVNDGKSTTGLMVMYGSTLIGWYSSKQTTVAQSTTDAESFSINFAVKEAIWLRGLLSEMGIEVEGPTNIHTDSQAALQMLLSKALHKRTKHIMLRIAFVIDEIAQGNVLPVYIKTTENLADGLTKSQPRILFQEHVKRFNMRKPSAQITGAINF